MSELPARMAKGDPCPECGTPMDDFRGEPADQFMNNSGALVSLTAIYTLLPCGHSFRVSTGERL